MSRKEYWQNRKDRVSEYICVRAIFGVFNSFTVKMVKFFTITVKFEVILSSKNGGGGIFVQAIPPPQKVGGIHPPHPPRIYASDWFRNSRNTRLTRLLDVVSHLITIETTINTHTHTHPHTRIYKQFTQLRLSLTAASCSGSINSTASTRQYGSLGRPSA